MKSLICLLAVCSVPLTSFASICEFTDTLGQTALIEVEYWTGAGDCETILVIDWNQSGDYVSESHAFGFRWDGGVLTVADMLTQIADNGGLEIDTGYGGAFVNNLTYNDADGDIHIHNETGSWNLGSTGDVFAEWGNMSGDWSMLGEWQANQAGITSEYITDGQLEGINAMYWFDTSQPYMNLDVPIVPEPATVIILGLGGLFLRKKRTV